MILTPSNGVIYHDSRHFDKPEDFFIVPGREILGDIDKFFGASYRDPANPSNMPAINYGPLAPYRANWKVFDE
jgi:hypothetical protein